jgi:D-serine deaminase-like pyridoxal phosphate-dependent protein
MLPTVTDLTSMETPAAIIDVERMRNNISRMQSRMTELQVKFRPHVKTAKCLEVAYLQREAGASGVTVSTLKEAEEFFAAGFTDILYAVCIAPNKLKQASKLIGKGCALKILVDSVDAARMVARYSDLNLVKFDVWIEIDTDGHRSGVQPESDDLLAIGRELCLNTELLSGVMTHAGGSYALNTPDSLAAMAEQERSRCVRAAERLRAAGLPCVHVSVGSTPTALSAKNLSGVTEVRAGVYVFFDLVMANVGVCSLQDVALSVLTTVIGHQAEKGWVIVDAGWMAMSRDRGTQEQTIDFGYGQVCDLHGNPMNGVCLTGANQEHGIITQIGNQNHGDDLGIESHIVKRFPVGMQLLILPNHACATGAQFPAYQARQLDGSIQTWPRFYGW